MTNNLADAWMWYEAVIEAAKRLGHLSKYWAFLPWDGREEWTRQLQNDKDLDAYLELWAAAIGGKDLLDRIRQQLTRRIPVRRANALWPPRFPRREPVPFYNTPENQAQAMAAHSCSHTTDASFPHIPIHGSRLVLCRECWAVVVPASQGSPRRQRTRRAATAMPTAGDEPAVSRPPARKPLTPWTPSRADDLAVPPPRRRSDGRFRHSNGFYLLTVMMCSIVVFSVWFCLLHYPIFREYSDPTRQYSAQFPAKPLWSGGGAGGGSDGEAARKSDWISETYQIRVVREQAWLARLKGIKDVNSRALAVAIGNSLLADKVRPRPDILIASAAIEYEVRLTTTRFLVCRVLFVNGFAYEMTVTGQNLALDDWRVQCFFDSFQLSPP